MAQSSFPFSSEGLLPQEEMIALHKKRKKLQIGVPSETDKYEYRLPLSPESVDGLIRNGHDIVIQRGAGKGAHFTDLNYSNAGAFIVDSQQEIYQSDIILKVAPPRMSEIELMRKNQTIISALHLATQNRANIQALMEKKVTTIAYEFIRDAANNYPVVRAMSEISGNSSILIAAEYLSNSHGGKGVLLGGITGVTPTEIIIIGAGTAGEFAARAALGLGASIKVFDNSIYKLNSLQHNIGQRVYTSVIHQQVLHKALLTADVVISALPIDGPAGYVISEEMVRAMKSGAILIDLSIDSHPCSETSRMTTLGSPTYVEHDVIHYCVPNIAARVAKTATISLSNIFSPILLKMGEVGGLKQFLRENYGLRKGVYIYNGILVSSQIGEEFGLNYKNIDLLMAAF